MSSARLHKTIPVLDLDKCSFGDITGPHYLSRPLVARLKSEYKDGFFVCTARCKDGYLTYNYPAMREMMDCEGVPLETPLVHIIVQHLETLTGMPCLGVSSYDDHSTTAPKEIYKQMGYGYQNILKPAELAIVAELYPDRVVAPDEQKAEGYHEPVAGTNILYANKEKQITQIAHHLAMTKPDEDFTLDFYDDKSQICDAIVKLDPKDIPAGITIRVLNHCAGESKFLEWGTVVGVGERYQAAPVPSSTATVGLLLAAQVASVTSPKSAATSVLGTSDANNSLVTSPSVSLLRLPESTFAATREVAAASSLRLV